jgi:Protein of unknown function DUF262
MTRDKNSPPSPEVQYLPAIFRRIQSGDIRMPAFQRGFIWDRGQVIELLESIYNGFPIGSVLLWRTNQKELNLEDPTKSNFPRVRERYPVSYVLDGLQRLSTLYAVFHYDRTLHESKFDLGFDLVDKEFDVPGESKAGTCLPLNVLFKPTEFIKYHSTLQREKDGPLLIQNAVDLLSIFQEYLLPIVTIEGRSSSEVAQIFERINSTGARLGAVDFMRAVTWSEQFDLNRELERLAQRALDQGFAIPPETLMKVIALSLGYGTSADSMMEMRSLVASQLRAGVDSAIDVLGRTFSFLKEQLGIENYGLVPYEAQFLALAGFCKAPGRPLEPALSDMTRWFWTASLNEDLQGRSEHQVARIVKRMEDVRAGKGPRLRGRLSLGSAVLKERRFRWGGALSSVFATMLGKNRARSLISGQILDPRDYLGHEEAVNFVPFADERQVAAALGKERYGGKVIANTIVAANDELSAYRDSSATQTIRNLQRRHKDAPEILASQFISESAATALLKGRVADYLEARAQSILDFAGTLAFPGPGRQ